MRAMERCRDVATRLLNLKLERLAFVSDCQRALMSLLSIRKAFAAQSCARLLFHLAKYFFQCALRLAARFQHHCMALIFNHIGSQHADGGQRARRSRHEYAGNPQRAGQSYGVQTSRPTERNQRKVAWGVSAL